jgi:hypothetical protein
MSDDDFTDDDYRTTPSEESFDDDDITDDEDELFVDDNGDDNGDDNRIDDTAIDNVREIDGNVDLDEQIFNGFFVVGDIHFRSKHVLEAEEFSRKCLEKIRDSFPSAIILLGDVLDTHEVARNVPFKMACAFIEECSKIAPTFVLVGNHDYINNSQYLTDNHFFVPLKKWPNVFIIDKPMKYNIAGVEFMLCPYVPNGRFIESIVGVYGRRWNDGVHVVFAHQEIQGVNLRANGEERSTDGDKYGAGYPPLISGHIHTPQRIGKNVYYPGSAMQISSDEDPDKKVWIVNVDSEFENGIDIDEISLELKGIKTVRYNVNEIAQTFDASLVDRYYLRVKLDGTQEQFKVFRKTKFYDDLCAKGVRIAFEPQISSTRLNAAKHLTSFTDAMNELIRVKSDVVQKEYVALIASVNEVAQK